jgi:predicted AlkP superfamily phosphohydrolase/phosphomutase
MLKNSRNKSSRVLVIGLDGATFDIIKPLMKEGRLPNLKNLMEHGSSGVLNSLIYPNSPMAWSSIITGKNPGKHGIQYFMERIPNTYKVRYTNSTSRKGTTIFRYASDAGRRVLAMNVPITYPPEQINGVFISGSDAPSVDSPFTYPAEVFEKILDNVGEYIIELRIKGSSTSKNADIKLSDLHKQIDCRLNTFRFLFKEYSPDFSFVVFTATDRVQHRFWRYMDRTHPNHIPDADQVLKDSIFSIYEHCDTAIGKIIEALDDKDYLIIISDHGFGPATNNVFYVNKWLWQTDLLKFRNTGLNSDDRNRTWFRPSNLLYSAVDVLKSFYHNKLNRKQKDFLLKYLPGVRNRLKSYLLFSKIDWQNTKAFSDENTNTIWINLKGRDPAGTVEPGEEYDRVREDIINKMSEIKDGDGNQIINRTYKREELYHGEFVNKFPDLIFTFHDEKYRVRRSFKSASDSSQEYLAEVYDESWPSGYHRLPGIFMMKGPDIKKNKELEPHTILDIMPTVLYALNCGIPNDLDGQVIEEAFVENRISSVHKVYINPTVQDTFESYSGYSSHEEKEIEERLRDLGYIE